MALRRRISPAHGSVSVPNPPSVLAESLHSPEDLLKIALGAELTLNIPDDAKMSDIEATLSIAITGYKRLSEASERLKPIIGRLLFTVQARRLYRPEYRNLTDYIEKKITGEMGLSRTNAFEALRIAKAFPSMSLDDYQKYGASRLLLASSITDESDPGAKALLDESTQQTVDEFSDHVKDIKSSSTSPSQSFVVSIRLPLEWKARWDDLLNTMDMPAVEVFLELVKSYIEHHPAPASAKPQTVKT